MHTRPQHPPANTAMSTKELPFFVVLRRAFLLTAVAAAMACGRGAPAESNVMAATAPAATLKSAAEIRDLDIVYFTQRAERDPTGALDLARLGALYLARGRESGDRKSTRLNSSHRP